MGQLKVNYEVKFQSAPLTDVRGDRWMGNHYDLMDMVSIRSPH